MKTAKHPSGISITFDDKNHRYVDEQGKVYYSTTKVIHSLFPKFDAERIAGFVARKRGCNRTEVLEEWEFKRRSSSDFGTKVHSYADYLLTNDEWKDEWLLLESAEYRDKFPAYAKQLELLIPKLLNCYELIEAEKMIFSPAFGISGTLDLLMRNKRTGCLAIFDWKSNETIASCNKHKPEQSGLYGLSHILDSNFWHYTLQLSTYRQILINEKYYDTSEYELAIFHIRENEVIPYKLPLKEQEAIYIMSVAKNPIPELKEIYEDSLHDND